MTVDVKEFYQATNPKKTLDIQNPEDGKYYIDFSSVRGGPVIDELKDSIAWSKEEEFTCKLFTGHMGCGKSTELLRLKKELEEDNYHVVYFESDGDLDMGDVDVSDILLAIARRVSASLEVDDKGEKSSIFQSLLEGAKKLLLSEIQVTAEGKIPGVGDFEISSEGNVSLSTVIGKITATTKKNHDLRDRLREYLEPKTDGVLDVLNQGLFEPIAEKMAHIAKKGLVVIIDNLDRLHNIEKPSKRFQSAYLFADRGAELNRLHCHVVYTMPLALRYSDDYNLVRARFPGIPVVLPMVPIKLKNGNLHEEGMALLRQMVLARALPKLDYNQRLAKIPEIFDSSETLDYLCLASGGHVRNLMVLINSLIAKEKKLPLSREKLKAVIINQLNEEVQGITEDEWDLLYQVKQEKNFAPGHDNYQKLIRNLLVYEYRDENGSWYDVNPVLAQAKQFKSYSQSG